MRRGPTPSLSFRTVLMCDTHTFICLPKTSIFGNTKYNVRIALPADTANFQNCHTFHTFHDFHTFYTCYKIVTLFILFRLFTIFTLVTKLSHFFILFRLSTLFTLVTTCICCMHAAACRKINLVGN